MPITTSPHEGAFEWKQYACAPAIAYVTMLAPPQGQAPNEADGLELTVSRCLARKPLSP